MRKFLVSALAVGSLFAMGSAHAEGRTVEGSILAPTFRIAGVPDTPATAVNGVYFRQARCAYVLAESATGNGADSNGLVGWVVELTEEEGDGAHTFAAASAANISVGFYEDLGTCENQPPSTPSPDPGGTFDNPGNESGLIPFFASHAIIVVEDATQVDFTFTISAGDGDGR
jgi:hypothetical protein